MDQIANWLFREDETLSPRTIVTAGLLAYLILFLRFWLGWAYFLLAPVMVLALALLTYALLRALLPRMDRSTGNDPVVIWGALALFLAVGLNAFGLWFLPAIFIGGALIVWRAPELLEAVPLLTRNLD
ncbi:hypothetical protein ACW9UR_17330 [Halovulum sp. GXIMD14794]